MNIIEKGLKLLIKIKHIVIGWYRGLCGYKTEESRKRLEICMSCPNKIKIGKDWVCSECYCVCKFKVLVPEEKCLNGKW